MSNTYPKTLKVGVFDSGLGGLTVLKSLTEFTPHHEYFYLGDSAHVPYGNKSPSTIKKYVKECIQFLLTKKVDVIVVACNSASSVLENQESYPVPIFDVIQPSALMATKTAFNERIAVVATTTTVHQKSYVKAIQKLNPHISVFQQPCPLLVPFVEEGLIDDPLTNLILYRYLNPILQTSPDCIILGCTHYPLLLPAIKKVVGKNLPIISSAEAVARQFCETYPNLNEPTEYPNKKLNIKIFMTDESFSLKKIFAYLFSDQPLPGVEIVKVQNYE